MSPLARGPYEPDAQLLQETLRCFAYRKLDKSFRAAMLNHIKLWLWNLKHLSSLRMHELAAF